MAAERVLGRAFGDAPVRFQLVPHALGIVAGTDTALCWVLHITRSHEFTTIATEHESTYYIIRLIHTGAV